MSALGQKQTLKRLHPMSALPLKADIGTGMSITLDAATLAAWRYSPRSVSRHYGCRGEVNDEVK
jgi:hypothetical protein